MTPGPSRGGFFDDLARQNDLPGFRQWFFYSGMLFGGDEKWWGKGGTRPDPHEGLDICYYLDDDGKRRALQNPIVIPAADDGVVFAVSDDDYLGKSIFVRHTAKDSSGMTLHSVYAHAVPSPGLCAGSAVARGEIVATMADIRDRGLSVPGHIHLSMVFLAEDYPLDMLRWQILSLTYQARLVDPMAYLACDFSVAPYEP
ncbi:hypothetical protein JCM14469_24750 [Desulfatiferula olefinivorans]